jgi:hypothetical protein
LALLGTYRQVDLLAALERASRYTAFSLRSVERILAAQARPKPALESWTDEQRDQLRDIPAGPAVPPRPTSEYQSLLSDEPSTHEPPIEDQERRETHPEAERKPGCDGCDGPGSSGREAGA